MRSSTIKEPQQFHWTRRQFISSMLHKQMHRTTHVFDSKCCKVHGIFVSQYRPEVVSNNIIACPPPNFELPSCVPQVLHGIKALEITPPILINTNLSDFDIFVMPVWLPGENPMVMNKHTETHPTKCITTHVKNKQW